jgi:predicted ATPase/serine/threonine protein kinase
VDIRGASGTGEQAEELRKQGHIGQQFGNYHVLRLLGRGGTASVYLGEHVYLKSHAALKILHIQLTEGGAAQFLQEAQTLARLSHPHIVQVLDFAVQDSIPFLVMDYATGGNLRQRHSAGIRLPLDTVVSYVQQLASALQYAHDQRLIHRDIKPENMLLSSRDDLLLGDFGLALFAPSTNSYSTHAMAQQVAGTSLYLAPEQLQGRPRCASDQYSLAVVVYEWLCGTPPFKGTPLEIAIKHVSVPPPPLRSLVSDLSPALEEVVLRALAKEPQQRFDTVQEFALALQQAAHGSVQLPALRSVQHESTAGDHKGPPRHSLPHSPLRSVQHESVGAGVQRATVYDQYGTSTHQPIWRVPTVWTPLIGREQEVAATCALLLRPQVRLLTLLGTGGIGKTRLSIQVANELRTGFADGICFVSLATIQNPDQVMSCIAHELDLQAKDSCPFEQVKNFLCKKHLLLILDNFEQVIQAAPSIEHLLGACPHLKIFVTSRVALHIQGEQRLALHPLALPDLKRLPEKEAIAHYASVALFVQCAQARIPSFDVTSTNAATLAEICVRLDGLPLAIELAAARIKLLPPQALLPRLAHRLQVLTGGAATLPTRQQALRSTIQWSYDLLEPWEQQLFRRLAVFVGGCNLQAVEALYAAFDGEGSPGAESVLDMVDSLIEKSLLQVSTDVTSSINRLSTKSALYGQEEEPRLSMLETIREYALECLAANGELEVTRQVHADYYLALAAEVEPKLGGPDQATWLDQLEREHDNLRAALQWSLERGEAEHRMEMALRFGGVLRRFWLVHGHLNEGRIFLERALAQSEGTTASVRAKALNSAANIALNQGYVDRAEVLAEESLALYRELGDTRGIAFSLHQLERVARARGNLRASRSLSEEALALFKEAGDKERVAWSLFRLARLHREQGEYSRAYALAEESLAVHRELGIDILPRLKPGDSPPHDGAFLLRWRLPPEHRVVRLVLHRLHRHWLSLSPRVASQSGEHQERGSCSWQSSRECTVVEHASAFTQASDLAWNPQTLFRCQSTGTSVSWLSSVSLSIQRLSTACGQPFLGVQASAV